MTRRILAALAALVVAVPTAQANHHRKRHRLVVHSTAYCFGGRMADGSWTRFGSVAMNMLPLGETIKLERPRSIRGRRFFHVRDRIGWGSQLDFWLGWGCSAWGRRTVTVSYIP